VKYYQKPVAMRYGQKVYDAYAAFAPIHSEKVWWKPWTWFGD